MALLGYDPLQYYTGRGALEALGMGFMDIGENAVGFRINFASYNDSTGKLDRRTSRDVSLEEQQPRHGGRRDLDRPSGRSAPLGNAAC